MAGTLTEESNNRRRQFLIHGDQKLKETETTNK